MGNESSREQGQERSKQSTLSGCCTGAARAMLLYETYCGHRDAGLCAAVRKRIDSTADTASATLVPVVSACWLCPVACGRRSRERRMIGRGDAACTRHATALR